MHFLNISLLALIAVTNALPSFFYLPKPFPKRSRTFPTDTFVCPHEGFFPNPTSCLKFIRCVVDPRYGNFTRYDFDCAAGTNLWCQSLLTCSFEFQCPEGCRNGNDTTTPAGRSDIPQSSQYILPTTNDEKNAAPKMGENADTLSSPFTLSAVRTVTVASSD